jgi:WD40 repeat protein
MRKANFLLVSLVGMLVFACGMPASPTPPKVESPIPTLPALTSTPTHTSTPVFTATAKPATPTLTPEPGLRTNGPYFAYFQQKNLILRLVLLDADGGGRRIIELPNAIRDAYAYATLPAPDIRFVSPDGRWLAYYTGSAGKYGPLDTQGTFDLALNLFDLETGEIRLITPLLSKEYPNNFVEAAQQLNNPEITADDLYQAFVEGITRSLAWSPDGQYMAFGGQMDGLSSDLYLYDMAEQTIQRLSSGDQELQWINWSPDGRWIVHSSVYGMGAGMTFDIYAASVDGFLRSLSTNILSDGIENWVNTRQYLESDGENVLGLYGLRLVDVDTGAVTRIWDETFASYAVDRSGKWVAILDAPDASFGENGFEFEENFVPALYLVDLTTLSKLRVDVADAYVPIEAFGPNGQAFVIGAGREDNAVWLSTDGKMTETDLVGAGISVSPNAEYWLATGKEIRIFSADNSLLTTSTSPTSNGYLEFVWRPDSSGAFLVSESKIYSMNIPAGDTALVETDLLQVQGRGRYYGWVGGQ